jgi:uncharacterized protein YpbB
MKAAGSSKFAETIRTISETLLRVHGITTTGKTYFLLHFLAYFHLQFVKIATTEDHFVEFGIHLRSVF